MFVERVLGAVIIIDLVFNVAHNKLDEKLVDGVLGLDLDRHGDEEGHEEHDAADECDHLLGRQLDALVGKLANLALVGQEAHNGGDSTTDHEEEGEEEDAVEDFVLKRHLRKAKMVHLKHIGTLRKKVKREPFC